MENKDSYTPEEVKTIVKLYAEGKSNFRGYFEIGDQGAMGLLSRENLHKGLLKYLTMSRDAFSQIPENVRDSEVSGLLEAANIDIKRITLSSSKT